MKLLTADEQDFNELAEVFWVNKLDHRIDTFKKRDLRQGAIDRDLFWKRDGSYFDASTLSSIANIADFYGSKDAAEKALLAELESSLKWHQAEIKKHEQLADSVKDKIAKLEQSRSAYLPKRKERKPAERVGGIKI